MKNICTVTLLMVLAVFTTGGCTREQQKISSPADLHNRRIGVLLGSTHDRYATKRYPNATILQYKSPPDVALAVKSGKVDAGFYARETFREVLRAEPDLGVISEAVEDIPIGVGFNKENQQLRRQFNSFLGRIRQNGVYDDMVERWLRKGDTHMLEFPSAGNNGTLVVGNTSDKGLPFSAVKDGRVIGFDNELAERFAANLGKKITYADMEFGSLITAVATNKVDMVVSTIMITEERKKQIDFSDPYYELGTSVFALKKNIAPPPSGSTEAGKKAAASGANPPRGISSIKEINGRRIAVLTGSAGDLAARRHFSGSTFLDMTAAADVALALKTGKIDAFVYDKSVLLNLVRSNPELVILDQPVDKLEVAAALRKENSRLLADMNRVLRELKDEGALQRLRTVWVDTQYTTPPPLPAAGAAGTAPPLRMGTCANLEPFSFRSGDGLTGLDIALSRMIGQRLGRNVEVIDMNFEALIPALQAGKIDFALSNFNVTEERKKLISYSLPYIENDISALVTRSTAPPVEPHERDAARSRPGGNGWLTSFFSGVAASFHSNIITEKRYLLLWDGLKTTVVISIFATIFGTLLGGVVCFMRMSKRAVLTCPARLYIAILRGTPVLVFLMLIYYVVFASVQINPVVVAVIAFGMNFAAYVAEIFRSGIEGIDRGQTEAGIALGFTRSSTFLHIILPQTVQRILPVYKGEFISLVKMTSIVGYIAVQDLTKASDIIRSRTFDAFFPLIMVAVLYFGISWLLMQSLDYLEHRTDPKARRSKSVAVNAG